MTDIYYKDTKKAISTLEDCDWTMLSDDLQDIIANAVTETEGLLSEYEERIQEVETLEEKVDKLDNVIEGLEAELENEL